MARQFFRQSQVGLHFDSFIVCFCVCFYRQFYCMFYMQLNRYIYRQYSICTFYGNTKSANNPADKNPSNIQLATSSRQHPKPSNIRQHPSNIQQHPVLSQQHPSKIPATSQQHPQQHPNITPYDFSNIQQHQQHPLKTCLLDVAGCW